MVYGNNGPRQIHVYNSTQRCQIGKLFTIFWFYQAAIVCFNVSNNVSQKVYITEMIMTFGIAVYI